MFTGPVSSFPMSADAGLSGRHPAQPGDGGPTGPVPAASAYWRPRSEFRADLRSSLGLIVGLALGGLPAGLLWWWLAPRAEFRISTNGPVVIGSPPNELLFADDGVLTLVLAGGGLLAGAVGGLPPRRLGGPLGAAAGLLRRRRGVAIVVGLAPATLATGAVAWRLGELLAPGHSRSELSDVGARVTSALHLSSIAVLAVTPFAALLVYLFAALYTRDEGLGRARDVKEPGTGPAEPAAA